MSIACSLFPRRPVMLRAALACVGIALLLSAFAGAESWPQFRGPNGDAVARQSQTPADWAADKNIQWKAKLPGYGWSSPIVWGDKVFVTTALAGKQSKPAAGFGGGKGGGFGKDRPPPDTVYKWELFCLN